MSSFGGTSTSAARRWSLPANPSAQAPFILWANVSSGRLLHFPSLTPVDGQNWCGLLSAIYLLDMTAHPTACNASWDNLSFILLGVLINHCHKHRELIHFRVYRGAEWTIMCYFMFGNMYNVKIRYIRVNRQYIRWWVMSTSSWSSPGWIPICKIYLTLFDQSNIVPYKPWSSPVFKSQKKGISFVIMNCGFE